MQPPGQLQHQRQPPMSPKPQLQTTPRPDLPVHLTQRGRGRERVYQVTGAPLAGTVVAAEQEKTEVKATAELMVQKIEVESCSGLPSQLS